MISLGAKAQSARTISLTSGAILPASLRAGTTTEMRGLGASDGKDLSSAIKKIRFFRPAYSVPAPLLPHLVTGDAQLRDPGTSPRVSRFAAEPVGRRRSKRAGRRRFYEAISAPATCLIRRG